MFIVTGGTHGIGRATAVRLAKDGHKVMIAGRDVEAGGRLAAQLPEISFHPTDVTKEEDCRALVDAALNASDGCLSGLVNNAGRGARQKFCATNVPDWDDLMNTNARSVYMLTLFAYDGLAAGKGSVVNVASIAGFVGEENLAIYTASKAAIIGLTKALAIELGHKIRFNAVCPGQVATRMMAPVFSDPLRRKQIEDRIPIGRLAQADEVGDVIVWLLSNDARYVNGSVITVDGGETAGIRNIPQAV